MTTTLHDNPTEDLDDLLSRIGKSVGDDAASSAATVWLAMIEEIMVCNAVVDGVNADLPEGEPSLHRPEGFARGFHDHGGFENMSSCNAFRITQSMLPGLEGADHVAWPPVKNYQTAVRQHRKGFSQREVRAFRDRHKT